MFLSTPAWLDLAKDYREQLVISALEDLIADRQIKLVVPQVVLDEFSRNKGRVIEDARRSLQSHFRLVRETMNRLGEDEYRSAPGTCRILKGSCRKARFILQNARMHDPLPVRRQLALRDKDRPPQIPGEGHHSLSQERRAFK